MSDDFGFARRPSNPTSLVQLKRSLRDLKLTEARPGFELRGKRVVDCPRTARDRCRLARGEATRATPPSGTVKRWPGADDAQAGPLGRRLKQRLARWSD
jgi:hypothetical protein